MISLSSSFLRCHVILNGDRWTEENRAVLVTVLGEIPNRKAAFQELYCSLKPGGIERYPACWGNHPGHSFPPGHSIPEPERRLRSCNWSRFCRKRVLGDPLFLYPDPLKAIWCVLIECRRVQQSIKSQLFHYKWIYWKNVSGKRGKIMWHIRVPLKFMY
jgi:hypothetical protein